jgi:hypothetical protein
MTTPDLATIVDEQEAEIGRLRADIADTLKRAEAAEAEIGRLVLELAVVHRDWRSDVGTLTARAQTAEARAELWEARCERAEAQAFHVTMETYRTGLVGDAFRFMRYWRDRSCRQSAAARKVARYAAQATASMGAMEEQVKDARAEAARLRAALTELVDLMQATINGEYTPDSFMLQPARAALRGPAQSEKGE